MDPLILTLIMDHRSQAKFDGLRNAHFPADRLLVGAHLTLFHALPAVDASELTAETQATAPFCAAVSGLRFLGRGVACAVQAPALATLRARLRARWAGRLTAQDSQPWHPHVTIQNKVMPATARALFEQLGQTFTPWQITALGLALWHYRGGPWQEAGRFPFAAPPAGTDASGPQTP
jgi:2'-5' RNA ligase